MSRSRYEEVAEQIRTQIADGTRAAGERLPVESALASNFGVSRSTIREALRVLGSEGLIRTTRGVTGGSFVVETGPETLGEYLERRLAMLSGHGAISADELLEARNLLEAAAARLAAARPGAETLAGLRATVDQESGFHVALLAASQNRVLELIARPVLRLVDSAPTVATRSGTGDDHARILERIEAGDAEGAANATAEHLGRLAGA